MVRDFSAEMVDEASLTMLLDAARRAPSAGNTQGTDLLVLEGRECEAYWEVTLGAERRTTFRWPGLLVAPVLCVVLVDPTAYVQRYSEPDKRHSGLGVDEAAWPVPYWFVDAGAAAEAILLGATASGLGACLFGLFDHERAVLERFDVPAHYRGVCTIAIGHPGDDARASRSTLRTKRSLESVVHRGRW
ncbi:MAG: nitroreductase family protein [Acidobacteria bacterium]|nr:nitroreductase family protein [Acidobacteriota bacterium]